NRKTDYQISKKDDDRFNLINFHPSGEPEAFMILQIALTAPYVIKGSASRHRRDSLALKCLAYESLRLVQNPGENSSRPVPAQIKFDVPACPDNPHPTAVEA
ncbi:MAG: hypothetical protein P8X85_21170, partial [Desulfobacterales bacterium]